MEALSKPGGQQIVGGVQEDIRRAAFFDPKGDFLDPGHQERVVGFQLRMADETHLRTLGKGRWTRRNPGLFRLGVEH
ncbi:hypothetical protein D3C84_1193060 [compost metagenome]